MNSYEFFVLGAIWNRNKNIESQFTIYASILIFSYYLLIYRVHFYEIRRKKDHNFWEKILFSHTGKKRKLARSPINFVIVYFLTYWRSLLNRKLRPQGIYLLLYKVYSKSWMLKWPQKNLVEWRFFLNHWPFS